MRETLHFAHGNGFPSPCYKQLLQRLEGHFDCVYIDKIGHNTAFPITDNWQRLVDELIMSITLQAREPVIAVGHSLGGVLSIMAAIEAPHLFKAIVLLDSPIIGRVKSSVIRISKALGTIDRVTPAFRTRTRQQHWSSRDEVLSYLRSRKLFKHFTDACLNDYIDYGLEQGSEGYTLRFDREIEYQIYRTIPHDLYQYRGRLCIPTALIYGTESTVINRFDLRYMKEQYGILHYPIHGTHLFPFEDPEVCADLVMTALKRIRNHP